MSWDKTAVGLFDGFESHIVTTPDSCINVRVKRNGEPILLLHGHPQTHVMWHLVAPLLAQHFSVVVADMRGYGDSDKPKTDPLHFAYSKRMMAKDMVHVMHNLGYDSFHIMGHDRGARCAYRLALDYPEVVRKLIVLDIIPTGEALLRANLEFSTMYFNWFFLAQPYPYPENIISANPEAFYFNCDRTIFDKKALTEYWRCINNPATIHAMCEDYRAGLSIDYKLDISDRGSKKIEAPMLILWAAHGELEKLYEDVVGIWKLWAKNVHGYSINSGHYIAEEKPSELLKAIYAFLGIA